MAVNELVVVRPAEVVERLSAEGVDVTLTGDGAHRYREALAAIPGVSFDEGRVPSLVAALELGATRAPSDAVAPLYLRDADAVANFVTRERL